MVEISSYGPWAVVTGASSGIGRAFAGQLAAAGLHLVLAARSTDRLEAIGKELSGRHRISHRVVTVDLGEPGAPGKLVAATEDLDVGLLVSNAGVGRPGRFLEQDLDDLHRRLNLNTVSHFELVHGFGRRFLARGRGGIVLVAALGAANGLPNMAHEGASKAYVHSLGEGLHHELAAAGIDVTVMLPGNVDTPVIEALGVDLPLSLLPADVAVRQTLRALRSRRARLIPDRRLRVINRLIPRAVSVRLNGRVFGKAGAQG